MNSVAACGASGRKKEGTTANRRSRSDHRLALAIPIVAVLILLTVPSLPVHGPRAAAPLGAPGAFPSAGPVPPTPMPGGPPQRPLSGTGAPSPATHSTSRLAPVESGLSRSVGAPRTSILTPSDFCYGVWPSRGGQSLYADDCYGHDEPGFSAYSPLPGSAGNVSWSFTLPVGRDATHNQSDLFGTFWFGMVLSDPNSALGQAFLELQFYPDHTWLSASTVNGNWIGAARVVQADLSTGFLDNAYISELLINGTPGRYLNMRDGDSIQVNLTGWVGNPLGERLVVQDRTLGVEADHRFYNVTGGYPLNPSYSTNSFPDALGWTNTGAPPVSFSFEVGHAENTAYPKNSSGNGCTPGAPPPSPRDPSVPCPSYDPSSWANDTQTPIRVSAPVFWNATARATAAEIEILNPVGGGAAIDPLSNDSCRGREGSAYCSYPWFSYSCAYHAFEFGATNYPETSVDFGKYRAYATVPTQSTEQFEYYPQQRFAMPSCAAATYSLDVAITGQVGGSVRVLQQWLSGAGAVSGLIAGNYSLEASVPAGMAFTGWTGAGGAVVADPLSPWTSVEIRGNGSVTASFAPTGPTVQLTLDTAGCPGRVALVPGMELRPGVAAQTVRNGALDLAPGLYSIQAMPDPGCWFDHWTRNAGSAQVADTEGVFTWLVVTGATSTVTVTATLAPSAQATSLLLRLRGVPGTVVFNGTSYFSDTLIPLAPGTYSFDLIPLPGNPFPLQSPGIAVSSLDARSNGNFTLSRGMHSLTLQFNQTVSIHLNGSAPGSRFSVGLSPPVSDGATVSVEQSGPTEYPLLAFPPLGGTLADWSSNPAGALWPDPGGATDTVLANDSGNLTARILGAPSVMLAVDIFPAQTGAVRFDLNQTLTNASTTFDVARGTHVVEARPAPGYVFWGWGTQGAATVLVGGPPSAWPAGVDRLVVSPGSPVLDAYFVPATFPVTFVSNPPGATATIGGTPVTNGQTLILGLGTFALQGTLSTGGEIGGWTSSPGLTITGTPGNYSMVVDGPGTIYAAGAGALDGTVRGNPATGTAPLPVNFQAIPLNGTPAYSFSWSFGDGATATGSAPAHTFESGGTYIVGVWINDSASATAYRTTTIDVSFVPLQPQISANVSSGTAPLWVAFNGSVTGGQAPYLYAWDFGDGSGTDTGPSVTYEFRSGGAFTVTMTVQDSVGSSAVATQLVPVEYVAPLTVVLTADSGTLTLGDSLQLNGVVSGGVVPYQYVWSGLPRGCSPSNGPQLTCAPTETGTFNVSLQVMDGQGTSAAGSTLVQIVSGSGGHGATPVGLFGVPDPYGLALIVAAVVVGLAIASLLLYRRRRMSPPPDPAHRPERETGTKRK